MCLCLGNSQFSCTMYDTMKPKIFEKYPIAVTTISFVDSSLDPAYVVK